MASKLEEIQKMVEKLSTKDRAKLANQILLSLDSEEGTFDEKEFNAAWNEEIEKRSNELKNGLVKGIPADQVLEKARANLK